MKFRFIEENCDSFSTTHLCAVMGVSTRGRRAFRNRPASRRQSTDMVVLGNIREKSRLNLGSYGRPRMTEELKEQGLNVGHRRVGRLMRENGIAVKRNKKFKATTDSNHKFNIAPNLLARNFHADCPNKKWASPSRDNCFANTLSGNGHQLYLDTRGVVVPGCNLGFAFSSRHRLGHV